LALAFATFSLASLTVVMSQSRGGILVFLTVFAVYFLKRFGWRGVFAGIALALPVLLLGGRSGGTAASSTTERLEVWIEGLEMVRAFPTLGVGYAQFTEHHPLTAHNSVLLAAAEGGLIAAMLWTAVIYVSLKIPLQVLRDVDQPGGAVARTWALALLASTAAATVGCMFLSFNYHFVLWIYVGMTASLATCVARHQPSFRVRFGVRDLVVVAGGTVSVLVAIFVATRAAWA
jgi:O-antigen ligase